MHPPGTGFPWFWIFRLRFRPKALIRPYPFQGSSPEPRNSSRSRPNSFAQCPVRTLPSLPDLERSGHGSVSRSLVALGIPASCWLIVFLHQCPTSRFRSSVREVAPTAIPTDGHSWISQQTNFSTHEPRGHFPITVLLRRKVSGVRVEGGISSFVPKHCSSRWTQGSLSAPVWSQIGPRRAPVSSWTFAEYPER